MAVRIPRGYDADTKAAYREISEGQRPVISNWPIAPYNGLPIFDMDQYHNDPIVIPAGTIVGLDWSNVDTIGSTGSYGDFVPAATDLTSTPGASGNTIATFGSTHSADETTFSISVTGHQLPVYPLGVVFKPIMPFQPGGYENYTREHKVPIVTDWVVQVPARTRLEHDIRPGDTLLTATGSQWNNDQTAATYRRGSIGTFMGVDSILANDLTGTTLQVGIRGSRILNYVVGKCLAVTYLGQSSAASEGESLQTALTNGTFSLNTTRTTGHLAAATEFHGLNLVQTVPGHRVSGSGTKGIPGFNAGTFGARADSSGDFRMLTILLRIV